MAAWVSAGWGRVRFAGKLRTCGAYESNHRENIRFVMSRPTCAMEVVRGICLGQVAWRGIVLATDDESLNAMIGISDWACFPGRICLIGRLNFYRPVFRSPPSLSIGIGRSIL